MNKKSTTFTVGELRSHLEAIPDDTELVFEHGLTFYRIAPRGDNLEQIEFNERFMVLEDTHIRIHADNM